MKILFFGEPLIRITPSHYSPLKNEANCHLYYGGSEVNIASNLSGFGISTSFFTGLPNHTVGLSFIDYLKSLQIDTSNIALTGERIGTYYLINGYGCRGSDVYYDRKNTSISDINLNSINMDVLFKDITHFHFSGITVAVSENVRKILLTLLNEAKKRNIIVSIDLNLRTKMISVEDAKKRFSQFAKYADYCFGIDPIMSDDNNMEMFDRINATEEKIKKRMKALIDTYHFKALFHTVRSVDENMINYYKSYAYSDKFYHSVELKTSLLERVGSGDAYVAGALYGIMNGLSIQDTINIAVASGTYKCTILGDNMFEPISKITQLLKTNSEISR